MGLAFLNNLNDSFIKKKIESSNFILILFKSKDTFSTHTHLNNLVGLIFKNKMKRNKSNHLGLK